MPVRFQVDPDFYDHPKTAGMSDAAFSLWVRAGSYSAAKLTDGFVSDAVLVCTLRSETQVADELVDRGLWRRRRGGYVFHEWSVRNLTRQRVEQHNKAEAKRKREARQIKINNEESQVSGQNVRPDAERTPDGVRPESNTVGVGVGVGVKTPSGYLGWGSHESNARETRSPPKRRCEQHQHLPDGDPGPNCVGCRDARLAAEQQDRDQRATTSAANRACNLCDLEGWRYEPGSRVPLTPYQRCDHRPLRSVQ